MQVLKDTLFVELSAISDQRLCLLQSYRLFNYCFIEISVAFRS